MKGHTCSFLSHTGSIGAAGGYPSRQHRENICRKSRQNVALGCAATLKLEHLSMLLPQTVIRVGASVVLSKSLGFEGFRVKIQLQHRETSGREGRERKSPAAA